MASLKKAYAALTAKTKKAVMKLTGLAKTNPLYATALLIIIGLGVEVLKKERYEYKWWEKGITLGSSIFFLVSSLTQIAFNFDELIFNLVMLVICLMMMGITFRK